MYVMLTTNSQRSTPWPNCRYGPRELLDPEHQPLQFPGAVTFAVRHCRLSAAVLAGC